MGYIGISERMYIVYVYNERSRAFERGLRWDDDEREIESPEIEFPERAIFLKVSPRDLSGERCIACLSESAVGLIRG